MSELRAPDPTLTALADDILVTWWDGDRKPPKAHRFREVANHVETYCGRRLSSASPIGSEDARWFAVPCRECFPDAPPPGTVVTRLASRMSAEALNSGAQSEVIVDPHLSWQVAS